jgi:hypothetical protein
MRSCCLENIVPVCDKNDSVEFATLRMKNCTAVPSMAQCWTDVRKSLVSK